MGDYVPYRTFFNVEGQDTTPVLLKRERIAYLTLPLDLMEEDVEHIINYIRLIAALGKDAIRPAGPPEPKDRARGWL
jgi:hypothetical protein